MAGLQRLAHRRKGTAAALALLSVGVGAGVVVAAGEKSSTVVFCAEGRAGDLTLARDGKCGDGQRRVSLRRTGRRGPAGLRGPTGPTGLSGTTASPAAESLRPVGAYVEDCAAAPGAFCRGDAMAWTNKGAGLAPVGYRKDVFGFVHLQGTAARTCIEGCNGVGAGDTLFYLPPGYRPTGGTREFTVIPCPGSPDWRYLNIYENGRVHINLPYCDVSLDGFSFQP